jgi:hypothetical protein
MRPVPPLILALAASAWLRSQEVQSPPPKLSIASFTRTGNAKPIEAWSPELRRWLPSLVDRYFPGLSKSEQAEKRKETLASIKIFGLPVRQAGAHLYLVNTATPEMCGATGNCAIELVEENANGIHSIASESGWGYYAGFHADSNYPDIFIASHMSSRETAVAGYVRVGGVWERHYCGAILTGDDGREALEFHVCP